MIKERDEKEARLQTTSSTPEANALQDNIRVLNSQIAFKQSELENIADAEEAAIVVADTLEIEGILLRDLFVSPTHYEFFLSWWKQTEGEKAAATAALEASYKSEIASQEDAIAELEGFRVEADRLGGLLADMTAKRDAAGAEIIELKQEVDRLTEDNESLRKQLESKPSSVPTNMTANLADLAKQIQAAKPGIYNKRWRDENRKTHFIATLSATGEEIEIPYLEIGKYREESQEEAERFRAEQAQAELARLAQETHNVVVPDLQFPGEEGAASGLDGDSSNAPVVGSPTLEERVEALEKRMATIERDSYKVAV
ncbi:hypothetical protein B1748_23575 [Paenibacillus sp. MY03]|nr:hypothetical protein B1748_23575 [Paenibacillus sp. MY03]